MDYSQFTDTELQARIKSCRIQIEILDQMEIDLMLELNQRKAAKFASDLQLMLYRNINSIESPHHIL